MVERLLSFSLKNRLLIILLSVAAIGGGVMALTRLPIDAFPDVSPVLVQIVTESPGLAPEEVEKLITYPVEVSMNGLPGVAQVKSISAFGISQVSVYFKDNVDIYFARQLTLEKLQAAKEDIPPGLGEPRLGPITTGLGQVYQYVVRGPGETTTSLRTLQDWVVKYNLRTVPGVTEVLSFGGDVKQFQIQADPRAMLQYGVTLSDIRQSVSANNRNVGGGYITRGPEEYLIRGIGLAETAQDLENIIVANRGGSPVFVRNVGTVAIGTEVRRGAVSMNGKGEIVTGIVLKRIYENTSQVITSVKARIAEVNKSLPPGVQAVPYYDQSELVERAVGTVREALLEGAVLIVVVLFLFLGNVRSALIVTAMLPLSLLLAFMLMQWFGFSANLMSLGGLAIAIGMMVDGGVVMVENVYRHLSEAGHHTERNESSFHVVLRAAQEVARPILFAIAIIILVFLPLLTLQGVEGKMFRPMAFAVVFAMFGSLLFSLTIIPVLCSFFLQGGSEEDTWIMRVIKRQGGDGGRGRPHRQLGIGAVSRNRIRSCVGGRFHPLPRHARPVCRIGRSVADSWRDGTDGEEHPRNRRRRLEGRARRGGWRSRTRQQHRGHRHTRTAGEVDERLLESGHRHRTGGEARQVPGCCAQFLAANRQSRR
jgi:cobalt-zinc-cadmium resistance protein CzcA